jgi:hypothetical protein
MKVQISKKIALIELQAHAEVLYFFANLLNDAVELKILTTADIFENAPGSLKSNPRNDWVIYDNSQSVPSFIDQNKPILNTCQSTFFITLVRDFRYFSKLHLTTKKILIVHNSYAAFRPFSAISLNFSGIVNYFLDVLRIGKFFVFQEFLYKKRLLQNFDTLLVPSPFIQKYIIEYLQPEQPEKIKYLEFSYFENIPQNTKNKVITITIPGTISNEGRDYEMVIKALKKVIPILEMPIQVILAGRPKGDNGQEIIEKVETLQTDFFLTLVFKNSIPQREYEAILAKTDFLVLPLKKQVKYGIYQEINGLSKITGSINDQIRYGLPALISSDYPLPIELENVSQRFKNADDLSTILENWIKNRPFDRLEKERQVLQKKYAKAEVKNALLAILK